MGNEYYPSERIKGHAGMARGLDGNSSLEGNNSVFLIELYKAFGKFHDVLSDCMINSSNFAVNSRAYDITDTN